MIDLLVRGLVTWRIATLLVNESGPFRLAEKIREVSGIEHDQDGFVTAVHNTITPLRCVLCTSLWLAPLALVIPVWLSKLVAISAIACLVEKWLEHQPERYSH